MMKMSYAAIETPNTFNLLPHQVNAPKLEL